MSVLSGKVKDYENVAYDGFDANIVPSSDFMPFQNGDEQSKCNRITQITPEIPTITLDDDDDDDEEKAVANAEEDDIALSNVVENRLPDMLGVTGISEITAEENDDHEIIGEDISDKVKEVDSFVTDMNIGGGDSVPSMLPSYDSTKKNLQPDIKNCSNINTFSCIGNERAKKRAEDADSDSEFRRSYNKKCHELIQQQCCRKRRRKRRRMKRMEERQSGIIVISSDENDSDDQFDYSSSTDDTDFKQPPTKMAKLPRKHFLSSNKDKAPHLEGLNGDRDPSDKSLDNLQGDPTEDNLNEEEEEHSESLSSTDMSSELTPQENEAVDDNKYKVYQDKLKEIIKEDVGEDDLGGVIDQEAVAGLPAAETVQVNRDDCNGDITGN